MAEPFNIVYLPEHILIQIFSFMAYGEISQSREVCQTFNRICGRELTKAFLRVDRLHAQIQKNIKSQLPRKESERRNHALSRFVDVLSAMETRLSLLSMTYTKYIDLDLCCFIPGMVLDEMYQLLRRLQNTDTQPPRSYDLLQSLRDLSTMAMEHFEEHIVPTLKAQMNERSQSMYFSSPSTPSSSPLHSTLGSSLLTSCPLDVSMSLNDYSWSMPVSIAGSPWRRSSSKLDEIRLQSQVILERLDSGLGQCSLSENFIIMDPCMQMHSAAIATMTKEYREQKVKIGEQSRMIAEQERQLQEQSRLIQELKNHMQAQEKNIETLTTHFSAVTGKEVTLPETKPWDQSLWDRSLKASTSSLDSGLGSEVPAFPEVVERGMERRGRLKERQAESDAEAAKVKDVMSKVNVPSEGEKAGGLRHGKSVSLPQSGSENAVPVKKDLFPARPPPCLLQFFLSSISQELQKIACGHSSPLPFEDIPPEKLSGHKIIALEAMTTDQRLIAKKQLNELIEEHAGCPICEASVSDSLCSVATSSGEQSCSPSSITSDHELIDKAQELYNQVIVLTSPNAALTRALEEGSSGPSKSKGKALLKRKRPLTKPPCDPSKEDDSVDSKTESSAKGRKRRRR